MENQPEQKKKEYLEISEKTKAELSALFNGEEWNGEKLPPVFLKLFSGPHETAKDAEGIKPLLDEADIYIPEASEWTPETLSILRRIANGERFPPDEDEFQKELEEYFFNTKKLITFIDVSKEEVVEHPELYEADGIYLGKLKEYSYEEAVELFFKHNENFSRVEVANRETLMANNFAEKVKELLSLHPNVRAQDAVRVLMTLGAGHSSFYMQMKSIGGNHVEREFGDILERGYMSESIRRTHFNKDISTETKERAFMEGMFLDGIDYLLDRLTADTKKKEYFLRHIVSLFSPSEMKNAFLEWKDYDGKPAEILFYIMLNKGIVFPKDEEELDAFLAKTPYGKYLKAVAEQNKLFLKQQKNG